MTLAPAARRPPTGAEAIILSYVMRIQDVGLLLEDALVSAEGRRS